MRACCSKEGNFDGYGDRRIAVYENECEEQENNVINGDYGASVRLQGSSRFVSMATLQGKKGINQDAMTVWEEFTGEKEVFFCGVFDGHGPSGHKVARTIRDELPAKISAVQKHIKTTGRSQSDVDASWEDVDEDLGHNAISSDMDDPKAC